MPGGVVSTVIKSADVPVNPKNVRRKNNILRNKINKENYHCLGTALQLKKFYNNVPNVSCINLEMKTTILRFCFDLDNTLVTYPKIPNDYSSLNQ